MTTKLLPESLSEDFLTLCCAERALHVFGLHQEHADLRDYIELNGLLTTVSVNKLRPVWDCMPKGTYWSDRMLDCVQDGLKYMDDYDIQFGRCYCNSLHPSYAEHENCLGAWLVSDKSLVKALGMYRNSRGPTTNTRFGLSGPSNRLRISEWVMSVESSEEVNSFGVARIPGELTTDVIRRIPVKKQSRLLNSSYRLEWIDEDGGYYLETSVDRSLPIEPNKDAIKTTSLSRDWLVSRGHRGGGPSSRWDKADSMIQQQDWLTFVFRDAEIERRKHHCPDWLNKDDRLICVFREGPFHQSKLWRLQSLKYIQAQSYF
ncbi:hypothetical protein J1614_000402 [Plenodomus biglobosus]|nr:hypothetical protein J1614_000402 [Plenodomus biglobosus]